MVEKLRCKECGVERRRLKRHLKAAHGMEPEAYLEKHPGSLLEVPGSRKRSAECRRKQSEAAKRRWSDPDERAAQSERLKEKAPWKGKKLSKAHREAISRGGQGVKQNLSPDGRKVRGKQGRQTLERIRRSPGYSDRLSLAQRKRAEWDGLMGFRNPETWQKGWETRLKNGTLAPPGSGRGITGFRKGLDHYTRSCLEANFARVLVHESIPYLYEPVVSKLPGGLVYIPDFYLDAPVGSLVPSGWVELKGWRKKDGTLPGNSDAKIRAFEEHVGEQVFVIVQSGSLWREIRAQYQSLLDWETPRRNLRTHPEVFADEDTRWL